MLKESFFGSLSIRSNSDWAYAQTVIEHTLSRSFFGSLSKCSKGHFLGPWAHIQRGICSRAQKMTLWAHIQGPKKWPFDCTLKDPKNDPLSVCSRTLKMTLWAYAQGPKKWPFECMLKDPKNDPLSIRSRIQKMTLWAYAQGHIEHFHMNNKQYCHLCTIHISYLRSNKAAQKIVAFFALT